MNCPVDWRCSQCGWPWFLRELVALEIDLGGLGRMCLTVCPRCRARGMARLIAVGDAFTRVAAHEAGHP